MESRSGDAAGAQSTVTVVGLGPMGSALARALLAGGHRVVLWNRTAARAAPFVANGAVLAATAADAIAASPLTLICVADHAAASSILEPATVQSALNGRTLVQMSIITAEQVACEAAHVTRAGGRFIMGCIGAYPDAVGGAESFYVFGGDRAAFDPHADVLASLGGPSHWIGDDPCAVPAAYSSFGTYAIAAIVAFLEGAALARSFGMPIAVYKDLAFSATNLVFNRMRNGSDRIGLGDFSGDHASVDTHIAAMRSILNAYHHAGIQARMTEACIAHLEWASALGKGEQDIACIASALWPRVGAKLVVAQEVDHGRSL